MTSEELSGLFTLNFSLFTTDLRSTRHRLTSAATLHAPRATLTDPDCLVGNKTDDARIKAESRELQELPALNVSIFAVA